MKLEGLSNVKEIAGATTVLCSDMLTLCRKCVDLEQLSASNKPGSCVCDTLLSS
jgi:hypothetical protein